MGGSPGIQIHARPRKGDSRRDLAGDHQRAVPHAHLGAGGAAGHLVCRCATRLPRGRRAPAPGRRDGLRRSGRSPPPRSAGRPSSETTLVAPHVHQAVGTRTPSLREPFRGCSRAQLRRVLSLIARAPRVGYLGASASRCSLAAPGRAGPRQMILIQSELTALSIARISLFATNNSRCCPLARPAHGLAVLLDVEPVVPPI